MIVSGIKDHLILEYAWNGMLCEFGRSLARSPGRPFKQAQSDLERESARLGISSADPCLIAIRGNILLGATLSPKTISKFQGLDHQLQTQAKKKQYPNQCGHSCRQKSGGRCTNSCACMYDIELKRDARRTELSEWHNVATDALVHEKS